MNKIETKKKTIKHIKRCKKCKSRIKEFWGTFSCPKCKWELDFLARGIPESMANEFMYCSCGRKWK